MTIAMYLRISSEDDDLKDTGKEESESISNQRGLLTNYISSHPEFAGADVLEFCDDGWSGKNFERPDFTRMMEQVKTGKIQCVLVKDLSRFGRDYLTVGNYISRVFPLLGVRFIAVNDGFDSSRQADIDSLDTSFKTLIYDLYSRELSSKVKNAKRQRAAKGLFLSPFAPYGFVKDPENKNHLLADPEAAKVVRRIFRLTAEKHSAKEIAVIFNSENIPSPMVYKRRNGCSRDRWPSIHEENCWRPGMISKILRDERYTGKTVYGKRERDMVGLVHTVKVSKADWIVVEQTHESIVPEELFQAAQAEMREYTEKTFSPSKRNPLRKKVICGTCGYAMELSNSENGKYTCRSAGLGTGYGCTSEGIPQSDIHDAVITLIRTYAQYSVDLERLQSLQNERRRDTQKQAKKDLAVLQSRRAQLEKTLQDLYEKLIDGSISRESYLSQKQSINIQMQELEEQIAAMQSAAREPDANGQSILGKYREYAQLQELTADIAKELVQNVVVYPGGRLDINLNYRDELEAMLKEAETPIDAP